MSSIVLSSGEKCLVDREDLERVNRYTWRLEHFNRKSYARCTMRTNGKNTKARLHRFILGAKAGDVVDHINGDTLDNRKSNLRYCTLSESAKNRVKNKTSKNKYKGVRKEPNCSRWCAFISINSKKTYLGIFKTEEAAAKAYNIAAKNNYKQFAKLNEVI